MIGNLQNALLTWDRFWFTPREATTLGWIRILSGSMVLYAVLVWGIKLEAFFGPDGFQDPELVSTMRAGTTSWSFWWLVPPDQLWTAHGCALAITVLYVLGLGLRATAPLTFVLVVSYSERAPLATFGLDQIITFLTAYVALAYVCLPRRDACLSLDRIWWAWRRRVVRGPLDRAQVPGAGLPNALDAVANQTGEDLRSTAGAGSVDSRTTIEAPQPQVAVGIATRLIQLHLCLIYLFAGFAKLKGEAWWYGSAVWMAAANYEYQSGDLTWMAWFPYVSQVATMGTVAWELSFVFLVWRPAWRPWMLAGGVLIHLGIGAFLGMWTFGLIMIVAYLAFAERRGVSPTCAFGPTQGAIGCSSASALGHGATLGIADRRRIV